MTIKKEELKEKTHQMIGLGKLATFINGDRSSNYPSPDEFLEQGIPFVSAANISSNGIDLDNAKKISREVYDRLVNGKTIEGDILFCLRGTLGKISRVQVASNIAIGSSLVIVRANEDSDAGYLFYLLSSQMIQSKMGTLNNGSAQPNISVRELSNIQVPDLGKKRQIEISGILNTLDKKISICKKNCDTLEAMARALFKSWFIDFDPVRAKAAGRKTGLPKEIDKLFPSKLVKTDLGEVPEGWKVDSIDTVADLNPEAWSTKTRPKDISYVDLSNTKWGRIEAITSYSEKDAPSRAQRVLRPMDTIVGTVRPGNGSYAFIGQEGLTGSTGFAVLRPKSNSLASFVYLSLTSPENIEVLTHLADGGAYPAVRPETVAATKAFIPGGDVLEKFSETTRPMLEQMVSLKKESDRLSSIRDTLLPELISN